MSYNKVSEAFLQGLRALLPGRVLTGEEINADFCRDEMSFCPSYPPEAVASVLSTEEVSAVCRLCYEYEIPFTPRGAGTGLSGAAVATEGGIILDMSRMNRILSYDMDALVVRVQPGVLVGDLQADADTKGVLYAPDPGEKFATVGGNVATNAGGMRACKYGTTRDHVKAMTVVTPEGEIMRFGAEVNKDCSGYSLKDLISGSEGTLAVITELSMRLLPKPGVTVSLLAPFEDLESAVSCVSALRAANLNPQALELMMRRNVELIEARMGEKVYPEMVDGVKAAAYLLTTFDADDQDSLDLRLEKAGDVFGENGALDVLIYDTADGLRKVWDVRGNALEALQEEYPLMDECDVVVPIPRIARLITAVVEEGTKLGLEVLCTGHAGDGNIHVNACAKDMEQEKFMKLLERFFDFAYQIGTELGGLVSGEHGIGFAKKEYLRRSVGDAEIELMRRIKLAFDPKLLLNPGKICC